MKKLSGKNAFEHGGKWLAALRQWDEKNGPLLDFSANINPLGLAASVEEAILKALPDVVHYPDCSGAELKQAISEHYAVEPEQITLGNGAVELLYLLCQQKKPEAILVPAPTFSEYERAARASGAAIRYLDLQEEKGFALELNALKELLPQVEMIFICNPNNPTGRLLQFSEVQEIVKAAARYDCCVVVDESFLDFVAETEKFTCRSLLAEYPNLCILHSLTKFYAIPGLRLGFMLCEPEFAARLALGKDPWNVNTLAQAAGCAGLRDRDYQAASVELVAAERLFLESSLAEIPGVRPYPGAVNFILLQIKAAGLTAEEFSLRMAKLGVLVRDCSNYPGLSNEYVRVAVRSRKENERLLKSIRQVVGSEHDKSLFNTTR